MNFKEFRRQLIWHFLGKYDSIFIYTYIHTYLSSHALTYVCMHFVRVYLVFTVRLARRQMPLTSYREIPAINAVRKIVFPQGQSHYGLGLHGSSTCCTIKDRSAVQSTCTASTTLLRRTSLSTSRKRPLDSTNTWTPEVPSTGRRCKNTHRGIEGNLHSVPPLAVSAT